jgi:hypothetical protein
MNSRISKAFDFASDITKQLITLSTGVIGAVITFGDHGLIVKASTVIVWALGIYGLSAMAGALTLMALTGQLGSPHITAQNCTPYASSVRVWSSAQVILFFAATGVLAWAAIKALGS